MRAVIQRVHSASVTVAGEQVSHIGRGLLALVGVAEGDTEREAEQIANKIVSLRLWDEGVGTGDSLAGPPGEAGGVDVPVAAPRPWRRNVREIDGQVLCVSQFTLLARTQKGSKPDFHAAAKGEAARALYDRVLAAVRKTLPEEGKVQDGVFGAMMDVGLINDGPVTILLDTADKK